MAEAPKTPKCVRSRDFRSVFSNALRMRVGDNDGAITFILETDDENGQIIHEDQVQVVMTPRSIKILHFWLTHAITELERSVGPITLAPEKLKEFEKVIESMKASSKS